MFARSRISHVRLLEVDIYGSQGLFRNAPSLDYPEDPIILEVQKFGIFERKNVWKYCVSSQFWLTYTRVYRLAETFAWLFANCMISKLLLLNLITFPSMIPYEMCAWVEDSMQQLSAFKRLCVGV